MAQVPPQAYEDWDGQRFRDLGLTPSLSGVVLGNALSVCPTSDGERFRAPSDAELRHPVNQARLLAEIRQAQARAPGQLALLALGRRAGWILAQLDHGCAVEVLPHPSAQGLLQAAPNRGKGMQLRDLQADWQARLTERLVQLRAETQRVR